MPRTWVKNNTRIVRFAGVGVINTSLDFGILFLLVHLGIDRQIANIISTTIAFAFSFIANRKFTFQSTGENVRRELIYFMLVTLFGLWALQTIIIWLGAQVLGHSASALLISKLIATFITLVWNYVMYARVVFRERAK